MFKILIKTILDDFRDENNHLFFASKSNTSRPNIVAYLQETKNSQLLGLILRYGEANNINLIFLLNTFGILPSQLERLKRLKTVRLENLEGKILILRPPK